MAYRRLLAEEFLYAPDRRAARQVRAVEDAQYDRAASALRRMK